MKAVVDCGSCGTVSKTEDFDEVCEEGCPVCGSHNCVIYGDIDEDTK